MQDVGSPYEVVDDSIVHAEQSNIDAVTYVVPLEAAVPIPLIELYRPHIQAKGTDYTLEQMPERFAVEAGGGRIEFVGDKKTHSSSALRQALRERGAL